MINDELDLDERTLKEPIAGTSRSMQDLDSSQMITDDGFGGSGFGRKYSNGFFLSYTNISYVLVLTIYIYNLPQYRRTGSRFV